MLGHFEAHLSRDGIRWNMVFHVINMGMGQDLVLPYFGEPLGITILQLLLRVPCSRAHNQAFSRPGRDENANKSERLGPGGRAPKIPRHQRLASREQEDFRRVSFFLGREALGILDYMTILG